MKKTLLTSIIAFFVLGLILPSTVQAQASRTGVANLGEFRKANCTEDGRDCKCVVALRRRGETNPNTYYFWRGSTSNPEPHETPSILIDTKHDDWDYAFYVSRPGENEAQQTDCHIKQSKSAKSFKPNDPLDQVPGCIVTGVVAPAAGLVSCSSGLGGTTIGDLNDWFLGFDLGGNWDDVSSGTAIHSGISGFQTGGRRLCGWDDQVNIQCPQTSPIGCSDSDDRTYRGWSIAGWFAFKEDFSDKKVSRVEFKTGNDVICSLGFIKKDAGEPTAFDSEELEPFKLCDQISGNQALASDPSTPKGKCYACVEKNGIWTALGCIQKGLSPEDPDAPDLISDLIGIGLGLAGGIALLLILAGSATYAMSQGDPKKATDAKETITAAIIGLLFIVFSVTILQFIGFTILRIPGF